MARSHNSRWVGYETVRCPEKRDSGEICAQAGQGWAAGHRTVVGGSDCLWEASPYIETIRGPRMASHRQSYETHVLREIRVGRLSGPRKTL